MYIAKSKAAGTGWTHEEEQTIQAAVDEFIEQQRSKEVEAEIRRRIYSLKYGKPFARIGGFLEYLAGR